MEPETKLTEEPKVETALDRAQRIADQQDRANKTMSDNLDRAEKLKALETVGGRAEAGQAPVEKKEETAQEYAKRVMGGALNGE